MRQCCLIHNDKLLENDIDAINNELKQIGVHVESTDLTQLSAEIQPLLCKPTLTDSDRQLLIDHLTLPREKLLEKIAKANRQPHVANGGALETFVETHGYGYPTVYLVEEGIDYSVYDTFHINQAEDGTGVDEIVQLLSGGPFVFHYKQEDDSVYTLELSCDDQQQGWLVYYSGANPHIGSVSKAAIGSRGFAQVIGPEKWSMIYPE